MLTKDDLEQIGKVVDKRIEPVKRDMATWRELASVKKDVQSLVQGQKRLEQGQARTNTALEALKAGQDDMREKMATKQDVEAAVGEARAELKTDILTIDKKLVRKVQSHERRMDAAGIPNPEKH